MSLLREQSGFTLPELLVVVCVFVFLLVGSTFVLRSQTYEPENRDAQRRLTAAQVLTAIYRYRADKGKFPDGVGKTPTEIGSENGEADLCKTVVPDYLPDAPLDPVAGKIASVASSICGGSGYESGYVVQLDESGEHVTIVAAAAEMGIVQLKR
jgi:prepilin-type N-terminal cleavage/methylation domain-containing protein